MEGEDEYREGENEGVHAGEEKPKGPRESAGGGSEEEEGGGSAVESKEERDGEGKHGRGEGEEVGEQRAAGEEHEDGERGHEEGAKERGHRGMEDQEYGDEERGGHEHHTDEGRHEEGAKEHEETKERGHRGTEDQNTSSSSVPLPPFGFNATLFHAPPIPVREKFLWRAPKSHKYAQCIARSRTHKVPVKGSTNGYLLVTANGGLNQMRAAICDMVAVARIMNVTLVVPELDHTSFWADPSEFEDIFDLDHFISSLKKDIRIVRLLPKRVQHIEPLEKFPVSWSPFSYYREDLFPRCQEAPSDALPPHPRACACPPVCLSTPPCQFSYYREDLLPRVKKHRVMRFPLTDSRLANNGVPDSIQRLRCRANYKHPRGEELKAMRLNTQGGRRRRSTGRRGERRGRARSPHGRRRFFLRAMGYPNKTLIYVAAGDIYGSNGWRVPDAEDRRPDSSVSNTYTHSTLATAEELASIGADLTRLYPNTYTHSTLATAEELASIGAYQNRLAAVDYTVGGAEAMEAIISAH
ncbi:unnamed protein product [Closterium sp. NIES-64]|nr:unnamed protein product [Closterium sp. NIES-64]